MIDLLKPGLTMGKNFTPENFIECRLNDKQFLNNAGFLLSSAVNNDTPTFKKFGEYTLEYGFGKRHKVISLSIYDGRGNPIAIAEYYPAWKPSFRLLRPHRAAITRSLFLEAMMPLDKDLAFWLLWNV